MQPYIDALVLQLGLNGYQAIAAAAVFMLFLVLWLGRQVRWQRAAAIAWSVAIFAGLSMPSNAAPDLGNGDKKVHALIFALFAFLWRHAGWSIPRTLAWGVAYAVLTEVYQAVMPIGRSGDPKDVLADVLGLLIGLALAWLVAKPNAKRTD